MFASVSLCLCVCVCVLSVFNFFYQVGHQMLCVACMVSSSYGLSNSVCASEHADAGKGQAHREVIMTVAEMKKRLPSDKRSRSKASTVEALHYALNCVKQVQGNMT